MDKQIDVQCLKHDYVYIYIFCHLHVYAYMYMCVLYVLSLNKMYQHVICIYTILQTHMYSQCSSVMHYNVYL